jgi:predicted PurR-regulated permease PerM
MIPEIQQWVFRHTSVTLDMQDQWLLDTARNSSGKVSGWLQATASTTVSTLFSLFLIPIYAALFLYHRGTFVSFVHKAIGEKHDLQVDAIFNQTVHTYFRYIIGMVKVYTIVGVLNSIGLLALGIEHAILFGMLTAIMTIIPYVGIIVSALLPISIAFITKDSAWYPLGVIAIFSFVQYLEANVIFPKVVGTQLNVSTWATLVAIIAGGIIWGVSGMILFIPFVAILKIVTDHMPSLGALNILLNRDPSPNKSVKDKAIN